MTVDQVQDDIARPLIAAVDLDRRVAELADEITAAFAGKSLTVVIVSNGAIIFGADLIRRIPLPLELDSVSLSSYIGTRSSGSVTWHSDLRLDVAGRSVLIVEDILDSGRTLARLSEDLRERGAGEVRSCVLLAKTCPRQVDIRADFVGFTIPDEFVVGYGLDYNEKYRNLPYVGILKPQVYGSQPTGLTV